MAARIPDLERRTVNPNPQIATVDPRGAASLGRYVASGIRELESVNDERKKERLKVQKKETQGRDKYEVAKAQSKLSILKHQQDNAFDEDDLDYQTYEERYSTAMSEGLDEIAAGITDPKLRELFVFENQPRIALGIEKIKNRAFKVESDVARGDVNSQLNGLRDVMLHGDEDDRIQAIRSAKDLLQSAKETGYYTSEEMVNLEKAYTVDAAIGYVNTLPLNRQRAALESDFIKDNVPADKIAIKLRSLKEAETLEKAQLVADDLIGKSMREQNTEISKYSGELRERIKQQVDYNNRKEESIKLNEAETLHQNWYLKVLRQDEGFTQQDLTDRTTPTGREFEQLPVKFQKDLLSAAAAASAPAKVSDPEVIDRLHKLNTTEKFKELRDFYLKNVGKLDATDMDTWSKISNEGLVPEEYESLFTVIQTIDAELASVDVKDAKKSLVVRKQVQDWYRHKVDKGQEPTDREMEDYIKSKIKEVTLTDAGFAYFDASKKEFELEPEDREQVLQDAITQPDAPIDNLEYSLLEIENSDDVEVTTQIIQSSLLRYDEMSTDSRERLREKLLETETAIYDRVGTLLLNKYHREPTTDELLDGMRHILGAIQGDE